MPLLTELGFGFATVLQLCRTAGALTARVGARLCRRPAAAHCHTKRRLLPHVIRIHALRLILQTQSRSVEKTCRRQISVLRKVVLPIPPHDIPKNQRTILLLPGGEGRDEGERLDILNSARQRMFENRNAIPTLSPSCNPFRVGEVW